MIYLFFDFFPKKESNSKRKVKNAPKIKKKSKDSPLLTCTFIKRRSISIVFWFKEIIKKEAKSNKEKLNNVMRLKKFTIKT